MARCAVSMATPAAAGAGRWALAGSFCGGLVRHHMVTQLSEEEKSDGSPRPRVSPVALQASCSALQGRWVPGGHPLQCGGRGCQGASLAGTGMGQALRGLGAFGGKRRVRGPLEDGWGGRTQRLGEV